MITSSKRFTGTVTNGGAVVFEMANLTAAEFQLVTTGTATSGTCKIQKSNDGTNWHDIASATGSFTTATSIMIPVSGVIAGQIRILFGTAGGTTTYVLTIQGKELV